MGGRVITSPIKDVFVNEDDAARAANAYAAKLSAQGKTVFEQYEYAYAIYQDDNGRWVIGDFVRGEEPVGNNAGKADCA